jgi:endonuclease G
MFEDSIYEANPLYFSNTNTKPEENVIILPEEIEVAKPLDLVAAGDKRQTVLDDIVDIFIAVAMPDPAGADASNEWVSLINLGSETVDLSGWKLCDKSDNQVVIDSIVEDSSSRSLRPGESLVLKGLEPLRLANKGGVIKLFNADNERIDWVNYTDKMVMSGKPVHFLAPRNTLEVL